MKTYYKPNTRITSPFQAMQKKTSDTQDKRHPIREEIEKCLGTYSLTAVIEEDIATQTAMKHVPGLISFLCTLLKNGRVLSQGRGNAILSPTNRYLTRAVASAFNSSIAEAAIRATKVLDTFRTSEVSGPAASVTLEEAYKAKDDYEFTGITDKQKSYLLELIQTNISDEDERNRWESQVGEMTRDEASEAIQSFKR